eukprot:c17403_g3_i1 orf=1-1530(-)
MLQRLCSTLQRIRRGRRRSRRSYGSSCAEPLDNLDISEKEAAMESLDRSFISSCSLDTLASVLQSCAKSNRPSAGKSCHDRICRLAFDSHPYLQSLLVQMYASIDALDDALSVFAASHHHHQQSFIWNHIINALIRHQNHASAVQLLARMRHQCIIPDKFTFVSILSLFTSKEHLQKGKRLHAIILTCGLHHNVFLATALITMYQKCGSLENAWSVFEKILQPDEVAWTSIIAAYAQHRQGEQALHLFDLMLQEGFCPNKVAFACTIDACANCAALDEGKLMHAYMIEHDIKVDRMLENSFIKLYGECGSKDDARHVYDSMQSRDVVSSNSLILAYAQHGHTREALQVLAQLLREGIVPNKVTYICVLDACVNAVFEAEGKEIHSCILDGGFDKDMMMETKLVKMYGKCGRLEDAQILFEKMRERNIVSWTTMIAAFAQQGKSTEALFFFDQMRQEGTKPNRATCLCMLDACASLSVVVKAKYGHVYVLNCGFESDLVVCNFLISMYGKC